MMQINPHIGRGDLITDILLIVDGNMGAAYRHTGRKKEIGQFVEPAPVDPVTVLQNGPLPYSRHDKLRYTVAGMIFHRSDFSGIERNDGAVRKMSGPLYTRDLLQL